MSQPKLELPMEVFVVVVLAVLIASGALIFAKDELGISLLPQSKNVFFAVLSALILALGGYFKTTPPEEFDPVKFLLTVIVSVFIGVAMYYLGLDYESAETTVQNFLINTGLLAAIETWLKTLVRRYQVVG